MQPSREHASSKSKACYAQIAIPSGQASLGAHSQLWEASSLADGQALPLCGLKKVIYGGWRQRWADERLGCKGKQGLGGAGFSL